MMSTINMRNTEGFIESRIIPKIETYYLLTGDTLTGLTTTNVLANLFTIVASLMWGAYFTILISLKSTTIEDTIRQDLEMLQVVTFWVGFSFLILAIGYIIYTNIRIQGIKQSKLPMELG